MTAGDEPAQPPPDDPRWREPLLAFGAVVVGLVAVSLLAEVWGPFADYLLLVAAAIFIAIPYVILRRRGADFDRFGIDLDRIPLSHIGLGILVTVVVFPFYSVAYHVWETSFLERDFSPSVDNYRQWPVELDAPSLVGDKTQPTVQIRTFSNRLHIEWSAPGPQAPMMLAESDEPFRWHHIGPLLPVHAQPEWFDEPPTVVSTRISPQTDISRHWYILSQPGDDRARLTLDPHRQPEGAHRLPSRLELDFVPPPGADPPTLLVGHSEHNADETLELNRTYWWLILWGLTHLLLVALPEEYFYRGYLQTRLGDLFDGDEEPTTYLGFTRANWATSALFALGHVLVPIGGAFSLARAGVFFPSLLFGWLRDRTGSIIAATVFHAGANMMVLVLAVHYF